MATCGVETKRGIPCQQVTDFLPCQYHDRVRFGRQIKEIIAGRVVVCALCDRCDRFYPVLLWEHSCAVAA